MRVEPSGFGVCRIGSRVLGVMAWGSGFRFDLGYRVSTFEGFGVRVSGFGCRSSLKCPGPLLRGPRDRF